MKYYKVSEEELLQLLEDSLKLMVLERDGVDNWEWYMEGRSECMQEWYKEDLDFTEAAQRDLILCFSDKEII
jgi:hypothetical protein